MKSKVTIYDTTLRDGSQGEGINFSLTDKLKIAERLSHFGIHYIEGGWPGSNEKDIAFFNEAKKRNWGRAKIAAFGSTRKANTAVETDSQVKLLLEAEAPVITFFGKSWLLHVEKVLRTTPDENLRMIADTVAYLKKQGREVIYDAEHFFDGYKANPEYALKTIRAAQDAGADYLVLCDTNGGTLPSEVAQTTTNIRKQLQTKLGIHPHNDCGLGVANAIAAIENGALQIQGTINGFGERTGNCNLTSVIPILELKLDQQTLPNGHLRQLSEISRFVDEIANLHHDTRAPFVGRSSFAHKGGMHVNAVNKSDTTYEHIEPQLVGNQQRILIGELSGRTNITIKAKELGIDLTEKDPRTQKILSLIKTLENNGYEFEAADASLELLIQKNLNPRPHRPFFELTKYHTTFHSDPGKNQTGCKATLRLTINGQPANSTANGDGPINALDQALRQALITHYPQIAEITLIDYKVRIIDSSCGTAARTRVLITTSDGKNEWNTIGVSNNIIEASWLALVDSIEHHLLKHPKNLP